MSRPLDDKNVICETQGISMVFSNKHSEKLQQVLRNWTVPKVKFKHKLWETVISWFMSIWFMWFQSAQFKNLCYFLIYISFLSLYDYIISNRQHGRRLCAIEDNKWLGTRSYWRMLFSVKHMYKTSLLC